MAEIVAVVALPLCHKYAHIQLINKKQHKSFEYECVCVYERRGWISQGLLKFIVFNKHCMKMTLINSINTGRQWKVGIHSTDSSGDP